MGMLFYGIHIHVEGNLGDGKTVEGIALGAFLGLTLFFVRYSQHILKELGYFGFLTAWISLQPLQRVNWIDEWAGFPRVREGSPLDSELTLEIPTDTEALQKKPDGIAAEIFRQVFFSVNCPDIAENVEFLLRKDYEYNQWSLPAAGTNFLI